MAKRNRRQVKKAYEYGGLHVSASLTNVAIAYVQSTESFVAGRVFPRVNVQKQADQYWVFDRDNRDEFALRAPATESKGITMTLANDNYFARKWALHYDIADEERDNADEGINLDRRVTQRLIFKGLLRQEVMFTQLYMKTGVWTREVNGVTASPGATDKIMWDDAASTPIEDVRAEATLMQLRTGGYRPNKFVMTQVVWDALVNHPDIVDRIKYSSSPSSPAIVTRQALAALFEIDQIFVMGAVQNTAKEGLAEANAWLAGKSALLLYSPSSPSVDEPSAGYTFMWTKYLGNSPDGVRVKRFRMEKLEADRVEGEMFFDMKKTASDLGTFFNNIVR